MRTENSFGEILNLVRKIILVALDFFKKVFSKQFLSKMKPREINQKEIRNKRKRIGNNMNRIFRLEMNRGQVQRGRLRPTEA